jgi:hypothetical protein
MTLPPPTQPPIPPTKIPTYDSTASNSTPDCRSTYDSTDAIATTPATAYSNRLPLNLRLYRHLQPTQPPIPPNTANPLPLHLRLYRRHRNPRHRRIQSIATLPSTLPPPSRPPLLPTAEYNPLPLHLRLYRRRCNPRYRRIQSIATPPIRSKKKFKDAS